MQVRVGGWEHWQVVHIPDKPRVAFRSAHGLSLRAHPGMKGAVVDQQIDRHDWSKQSRKQFTVV
jgi:hypothetical protein